MSSTRSILKTIIASVLVLLALLLCTDPTRLPSVLLIVPFLLLFVCVWLCSLIVIRLLGVSGKNAMHFSLFAAALPTLMLVLQSIGQLTIRDVVTISTLFAIAYFYVARFSKSAS